jgi:hypothetical protein
MINNPECNEPKITIKKDKLVEKSTDSVLKLNQLRDELIKRNQESDVPISILYEHKSVLSITYIDTPGLKHAEDKGAAEREALIMEYAKPLERILIFVEESKVLKNCEPFN